METIKTKTKTQQKKVHNLVQRPLSQIPKCSHSGFARVLVVLHKSDHVLDKSRVNEKLDAPTRARQHGKQLARSIAHCRLFLVMQKVANTRKQVVEEQILCDIK